MVFLWLFPRRDGRWSYYYYYYLAGLVGVVVVMCFANESGKCHKLRGVLLFSGVWVDNQAQQLGVCIASPSYFLSSLFSLLSGGWQLWTAQSSSSATLYRQADRRQAFKNGIENRA